MAIVVAIAALAHFTYFWLRFGSFYFPDSFTYLEPAKQLLQGHGFIAGTPPVADTLRTPGYPLLLALFGARTVPVIALQHLISCVLAAWIYRFTALRTGSRVAAMVAALLFAVDTPSIHIANKLLTETLFTALLFIVFAMVMRDGLKPVPTLVIGLLLGVMVLVRPIAMVFFAVVIFFVPRRRIIAFLAAALILPLAWATRNFAQTHVFTVSSIGDINMLSHRAAGALAIEDDDDFTRDLIDEQQGLVEDADDFIQAKLHIPDAEELPTAVRAKYYGQYATKIIAQHPVAFLELTIRGILVNLFDSDWDAMWSVSRIHPSILQLTLGVIPVIEFVFAIIGLAALWRRDRPLALVIALTIGYFVLMSAGAEAEARFRIPVVPEIAIAAGVGAEVVRRAAASR